MNIIDKIEKEEKRIKDLKEDVKFLKKEIWKNKDRLGCMKIDCKELIKTIGNIFETKKRLTKLYKRQNKGGQNGK